MPRCGWSESARRILTPLSDKDGLLTLIREGSGRRPAVYAFSELLNITEGRVVL